MRLNRRRFLQGSAALGAAGAAAVAGPVQARDYGAEVATFTGRPTFRNWTYNVSARPEVMARPATLADLQQVVSTARSIKAVGSGHAFSPCAHTDDTMIKTDDLNRILAVDLKERRVKVEAGRKLHAFNQDLAELGLALPSIGDIDVQSLAGLVSTGTHGTGMRWGSFSDPGTIHAMELVLADGSLLSLSSDRSEDHAALDAARLGLGALGIIYSLTLNLTEAHNLEKHSRLLSLSEALDPRHYLDNDHYEFFRFPFTDKVQAVTRNRTDKPRTASRIKTFVDKILLENVTLGAVLKTAALHPQMMPRVSHMLAQLVPDELTIDRSDRMMASTRLVRAYEMEYALPIANAAVAHERYGALVAEFAARSEDPFYANIPCECRFIRGDRGTLLSPSQGSDTCFFSVMSQISFKGYEPFFRAVEDELLALGGRPHWGKQFYRNPVHLYPRFADYLAFRQQWDPEGKFKNIYMDRLLAGAEMLNNLA